MNPGRELDILIAEKVMGLVISIDDEECSSLTLGAVWRGGSEYYSIESIHAYKPNEEPNEDTYLKPYSTSIEAAWEVGAKAKIESIIRLEGGSWVAKVVGGYLGYDPPRDAWPRKNEYYETSLYEDSIEIGETAPHAICLAALKAVGIKTSNSDK